LDKKIDLNIKLLILLIIIFVAILFLWNTPVVYPLKIFVVLLHEISHGLAAIITGGKILKIEVSPQQGGVCWSSGGWRPLVLMAGYLGSMFWGGLILVLAARTKSDKIISMVIGGIILLISLFFVRSLFGFVFSLVFGTALIAVGIFAPIVVNDIVLKIIGLTSVLYAILDIKDDLISRNIKGSDASRMSEIIPLPPQVWGIIWIVIAIAAAFLFLKIAAKNEPGSV